MLFAIVRTKQGYAGVGLKGGGLPAVVRERVPLDRLPPKHANRAFWAVPLPDCTLARTSLPPLKGKALRRAAEVQNSFQMPHWGGAALASVHLAESAGSVEYLLCGFDAPANLHPRRALPEPLAFVALADALGLVPDKGTVLVVCAGADRLVTVLVSDRRIGLMRDVSRPLDVSLELRLSMQQAYLKPQESLVPAESIVWFGETAAVERLEASLAGITRTVPVESLLAAVPADVPLPDLLAAVAAVAAETGCHWLLPWHMERRKDSLVTAARHVARWLLPLLLAGAGVSLGVDIWLKQKEVARYRKNIEQVQAGYVAVEGIRQHYGGLMAFLQAASRPLASVNTWQSIFAELSAARPDGVRLRTVNGNLQQRLSVQGEAEHFGQVAEYLKALKSKPLFASLVLRSSTDASDGSRKRVSFVFDVDWEEASRENR